MTTFTTLRDHPYAQAKIARRDDGAIALVSYQTTVIAIDPDGWMTVGGLYSMTTRKHIGAFMREIANLDYHTAKLCYERGWELNIRTGEIRGEGI